MSAVPFIYAKIPIFRWKKAGRRLPFPNFSESSWMVSHMTMENLSFSQSRVIHCISQFFFRFWTPGFQQVTPFLKKEDSWFHSTLKQRIKSCPGSRFAAHDMDMSRTDDGNQGRVASVLILKNVLNFTNCILKATCIICCKVTNNPIEYDGSRFNRRRNT